ncbi:MAG: ABC transporter substrate-binding protein [Mycobacteriaceae bacterium]
MHSARVRLILASVLAVLTLATACGSGNSGSVAQAATSDAKAGELRLGFFANVTHAPALVGVAEGILAKDLGATTLSTQVFNAGPATIEALRAGSLDAAYVGPSAAILGFSQTKGQVLRIVSGAASGGAQLVVRDTIGSAAELKGKTIASPQLGNTQDVALRAWLAKQGLKTGVSGGGDVTIAPQDNATTLQLFRDGKIDGAWLPEPWASRLVVDAKAKVLVDEKSLWPQGQFATTQLIVRTEFLNTFPGTVKDLLTANLDTIDFITANNGKAKQDTNEQIGKLAGKPLSQNVIDRAWPNLAFTADPLASTLQRSADDAVAAGTTQKADLRGIVNVTVLNGLLSARGKPAVSDAGLGRG